MNQVEDVCPFEIAQGYKFDFTEFDIVKEGERGPLFNEAMKRAKKFGTKDQFIITARPHAAKMAIFRFLDAQGLKIPFDNIITLESSSAEASPRSSSSGGSALSCPGSAGGMEPHECES